jgi:HD superfamily phosphohydrolase
MYWQVYLHKTVVSAESMLINILKRAKELSRIGQQLFATPALNKFLMYDFSKQDFLKDSSLLETFVQLDDSDVTTSVKVWRAHTDTVLSTLCQRMINRNLFKIELSNHPFDKKYIDELNEKVRSSFQVKAGELNYFILNGELVNNAYNTSSDKINILFKDGTIKDIAEAADTLNIKSMSAPVHKYYVCYPKS